MKHAARRLVARIYRGLAPGLGACHRLGARGGVPWDAFDARGILPIPLHYYHPYPQAATLQAGGFWDRVSELPGVRIDVPACLERLRGLGREFGAECTWPQDPGRGYYETNPVFGFSSAAVAHAMIRHYKPRCVIEVGSGNSTRILGAALERNQAESGAESSLVSIEPNPGPILSGEIPELVERISQPVEQVPFSLFQRLGPGDLLFIDSSHIIRYGSDVIFLYLEVLPRLRPGVVVHVHDIHLPWAYPREYFEQHRWVWNEQYLLQALLAGGGTFRVLLPCWWIHRTHDDVFREAFPHYDPAIHRPGSSYWMERADR